MTVHEGVPIVILDGKSVGEGDDLGRGTKNPRVFGTVSWSNNKNKKQQQKKEEEEEKDII